MLIGWKRLNFRRNMWYIGSPGGAEISNNEYYQPLIISLLVHAAIVLGASQFATYKLQEKPTDIEIVYTDSQTRRQTVMDPQLGDIVKKLEHQAKLLSKYTRKVKKQVVADKTGKTENRKNQRANSQKQDLDLRPKSPLDVTGTGYRIGGQRREKMLQPLDFGASTISDHIPNIKKGGFTALNTGQLSYYSFFSRTNEQVRPRWVGNLRELSRNLSLSGTTQMAEQTRITQIEVILDSKGNYIKSLVHRSSGSRALDAAATEAFRSAAPLNNPPDEMIERDGNVHLHYSFYVHWNPRHLAKRKK